MPQQNKNTAKTLCLRGVATIKISNTVLYRKTQPKLGRRHARQTLECDLMDKNELSRAAWVENRFQSQLLQYVMEFKRLQQNLVVLRQVDRSTAALINVAHCQTSLLAKQYADLLIAWQTGEGIFHGCTVCFFQVSYFIHASTVGADFYFHSGVCKGGGSSVQWMLISSQSKQTDILRTIEQNVHILSRAHRDRSIHIERGCQLHDVKMTRHGLLHKGLTSAD